MTKDEAISVNKNRFITDVENQTRAFNDAVKQMRALVSEWHSKNFSQEITDADMSKFHYTKEELTAEITMFEEQVNFVDNQPVAQANYQQTIDEVL